jgi:hypothetical protein
MASSSSILPTTPTPASKKRKANDRTPTAPRAPSPAESIAPIEMDMDMTGLGDALPADPEEIQTEGAQNLGAATAANSNNLLWTFGHPGEVFDELDWKTLDQAMRLQLQNEWDRLDTILTQTILAADEDEWQLERQLTHSFKGARKPDHTALRTGALWTRHGKPKGGTLAANLELTYRSVQNRSFGWLTPLQACWPPAVCIQNANTASAVWDFKLTCPPGNDTGILEILGTSLEKHYKGAFFAVVRATLSEVGPL